MNIKFSLCKRVISVIKGDLLAGRNSSKRPDQQMFFLIVKVKLLPRASAAFFFVYW